MLILVRADDTQQDVETRLAQRALTVEEIAAAPVQHVPAAFLAAVAGLFPDRLESESRRLVAL